jgi:hypothetical protein
MWGRVVFVHAAFTPTCFRVDERGLTKDHAEVTHLILKSPLSQSISNDAPLHDGGAPMTVQPLPTLIDTFTKSTAFAAEEVFFDCQSTSELRLRQYVLRLLAPQGRKLEFAAKETLEKLDNPSSEITFGRSPNADVSVKFDCCMSRLHAAIWAPRTARS